MGGCLGGAVSRPLPEPEAPQAPPPEWRPTGAAARRKGARKITGCTAKASKEQLARRYQQAMDKLAAQQAAKSDLVKTPSAAQLPAQCAAQGPAEPPPAQEQAGVAPQPSLRDDDARATQTAREAVVPPRPERSPDLAAGAVAAAVAASLAAAAVASPLMKPKEPKKLAAPKEAAVRAPSVVRHVRRGRLASVGAAARPQPTAAPTRPSGGPRQPLTRAASVAQPADSGAQRAAAEQPSPAAPEQRPPPRAAAVPVLGDASMVASGCAAPSAPKNAPGHPGPQPPATTAPEKGTAQKPAAAERAAAPAAPVKTPAAESAEGVPPLPSGRPQPLPGRSAATAGSSTKNKAHAAIPSYMRPLQRAPRGRAPLSAASPTIKESSQEPSPRPRPPAPPSADPGLQLPSRAAASASCSSSSKGGGAEADGGGSAPRRSPSPVAPASLTASASRSSLQTADSGPCGGRQTESRRDSTAPTGSTNSLRTTGSEDSARRNPRPLPQGGAERPQPGGGGGVRRLDSQGPGERLQRPPTRACTVSRRAPPASTLVRFWRGEAAASCVCKCVQGRSIEWILAKRGKYEWMEGAHHYIQWLCPKSENGVAGAYAPPLTKEDAALLAADQQVAARIERGFLMMAQFWGFEPNSDAGADSGSALRRTADSKDRLANIERHRHNYLRITRVLLSMAMLHRGDLAAGLAEALVDAVADGSLPGAQESLLKYWLPAVGGAEGKRLRRKASDAKLSAEGLPRSAYFGSGCRAALR